ncbi:MAG: hypothetical protein AAFR71_15210 [Pseudomonadota bacterium]
MRYLIKPKRNGIRDNFLGALACLLVAGILYSIPSIHAACEATRVGAQVYLVTCLWPVFTLSVLVCASIFLPAIGLGLAVFSRSPPVGFAVVSLALGVSVSFISMQLEGEFAPYGLAAGVTSGLVFALTRDHAASVVNRLSS